MQEIISFLNQGWVGILIGGALGLFLYWRSRIPGIITFQSRNVSLIGSGRTMLPVEIKILYSDTEVPRLTSSTIWFWNAGKKTVRGEDIVAIDPLRLRFDGDVLNVRVKKVSREALQITASQEERRNTVCCSFDFLDPDDGGVLEVLHSGSAEAPKCEGTIRGLPKGPQYWGSPSSRKERKFDWVAAIVFLIMGLGMAIRRILGEQYINQALPFLEWEPQPLPPWTEVLFGLFVVLFWLFVVLLSVIRTRTLRRQAPSSLEVG